MGKHGTEYARVERDMYPTPSWVVAVLAEHVELRGLTAWEPACGDVRRMAEALRLEGCARVYCTDIVDRGAGQDEVIEFHVAAAVLLIWQAGRFFTLRATRAHAPWA